MIAPPELYRRVDIERVAKRRWRLAPVLLNGHRQRHFRTYVTLWNAKRACRRFFPGVPFTVVRGTQ
jgi:hypothetical protein